MSEFESELRKQPLRQVPEHWRAQILAAAHEAEPDTLKRELQPWWSLLLWPSPKAWGALAALWVVMLCLAATQRTESKARSETVQIRMAIEQKRRLQAEIEEASIHFEIPKPRSEITLWSKPA